MIGFAVAFLTATVALVAANSRIPTVLRARSFEVVANNGKAVIQLYDDRWTGGGAITVLDSTGERRGWFRAGPYGGHLMLSGSGPKGESMQAALDVWRQHADLIMMDTMKEYQATFTLDDEGAAMRLHDKRGNASTEPGKGK